ncbi:MAG TPA: hypothetical protein VD996_12070 [Chitinophagaceae bacterium]|nr:hypothetical protein [Chitinophagaceae bacterium]
MQRRQFLQLFSAGAASFAAASCIAQDKKRGLGIALVGLGSYSGGQLAPALQQTKYCHLAGIVTGTPAKEQTWSERYNIPAKNIYNY